MRDIPLTENTGDPSGLTLVDDAAPTLRGRPLSRWHWLILSAIWLGMTAWMRPYAIPDEGRYAGVALDMWHSGSHLVPLLDGMPYFHKPPLYYWLAQGAFHLFGVSPWAARLPSWLAAWVILIAVYAFMRYWHSERLARISGAVLATQPFFFGGAQFANLDMLVASMIGLTILAGVHAVLCAESGRPHRWPALGMAAAAGFAVLAKGLIGIALPGLTLLVWLIWRRRFSGFRVLFAPAVICLFLVITLPWMVAMQMRYADFFHYFFVYQHFERFADDGFNNAQPFWYYLPLVAGLTLPWSLWLGGLFRSAFWRVADPMSLRALMAIWVIVVLGFFSFPASKLIGYALPVLAPLAILVAYTIDRNWSAISPFPTRKVWRLTLAVAAVVCVLGISISAINPRKSAGPLARLVLPAFQPSDQIAVLHAYPFDLRLFMRPDKEIWVVDNWSNPKLVEEDSWRKELADAAQFDPVTGAEVLVRNEDLVPRLCQRAAQTYWIWGNAEDSRRYPVLHGLAPYATLATHDVWRIRSDDAFKATHCGKTPTGG